MAGDWRARSLGKKPKEVAFPFCQFYAFPFFLQFAAGNMKNEAAHLQFTGLIIFEFGTPEDIVNSEKQFAGLTGFGNIIIDAGFQSLDTLFRF